MIITDMFDKICLIAKEIDATEDIEIKLKLVQKVAEIIEAIDHISKVSFEITSTPSDTWKPRKRKWF